LSYVSRQVESQTLQTFTAFGLATVLYIAIIAVMEGWGQWRAQRNLVESV
ncbi:TPA: amino acid ABC transporter permease, partial [Providencia stuartii]|nr:amino acid ABC transporter permease [Providencia stuartii]